MVVYIDANQCIEYYSAMNEEHIARDLKVLSEPVRVKIVAMLSQGEWCACELLSQLQITQPTLSHHMKVLSEAGLVASNKVGTWMHYSLDRGKVQLVLDQLSLLFADTAEQSQRVPAHCCQLNNGGKQA